MLRISLPSTEIYNEEDGFINTGHVDLVLEHSLLSISKWESKHHVAFLSPGSKTPEETLDYIRCMTINTVDRNIYHALSAIHVNKILDYINDPMTATKIARIENKKNRDVLTSEAIYSLLVTYNIPWDVEKWHLNRLIAVLNILQKSNEPEKKMGDIELAARMQDLNDQRKAQLGTAG